MGKVTGLSLVLAMGCIGCASDAANKNLEDTTGDAGVNAASSADAAADERVDAGTLNQMPELPYPDCDRTETPAQLPTYTGDKPMFTAADLKACQTTCKGKGISCFVDANCPGVEAWNDCAFTNLIACVGSKDKPCRIEFENFDCCNAASGCDPNAADPTCVKDACAEEITTLQNCYNADVTCNQDAPTGCFSAAAMP